MVQKKNERGNFSKCQNGRIGRFHEVDFRRCGGTNKVDVRRCGRVGEVSRPTVADEFTELTSDVAGGGVILRPIREPSDRRRHGEFEDPSDRRRRRKKFRKSG